jgi:N-acetyl-gamma-glutamyl-phosphate reductase
MINVGILGAAGYSGKELIRILLNHPDVNIEHLFGNSSAGNKIDDIYTSFKRIYSKEIKVFNSDALEELDLLFIALPSGHSYSYVADALEKGIRVIDLGGDFRLKIPSDYNKYYKHIHTATELLNHSVYGLSEWNEEEIQTASLVANPGCYPTSTLLALIPLLIEGLIDESFISITSYSGTSGAGRSAVENMIFSEVNESVRAYKVGNHQHIPEIKFYLKQFSGSSPSFTFIPHLLPVTRGIYTSISAKLPDGVTEEKISKAYEKFYAESPFIRLLYPEIPEMKDVVYTNFCDIGFKTFNEGNSLVVFSTIDNLIKGAAGQAIQNMNIMFDLETTAGLLPCEKKKSLQTK